MRRVLSVFSIGLVGLLFCALSAGAEWISTSGLGEQPPQVTVVSSNAAVTVLEVTIPGFYSEDVWEAGTLYQSLSFGDNAALRDVGKPQLPIVTRLVGIPDRGGVRVSIEVLSSQTFPGYRVYPAQILTKDGEEDAPFVMDAGFYAEDAMYPDEGAVVGPPEIWRDVRLTRLEVRPLRYNPAQGTLIVATNLRVTVEATDEPAEHEFTRVRRSINPRFQTMYRGAVVNFDQLGLPLNNGGTDDPGIKYLLVTTTPALPYCQAIADYRHAQGYEVQVRALGPGFTTAEEIKAYISQLYNAYGLEYVLLVGDAYYSGGPGAVDVPMYYWVDSYSDSWYTMMDGPDDYLADLAIGRIVYDGANDLTLQMNKTMSYLTAPEVSNWAEYTLLVAHQEEYPLKYTQCKEQIRTFNYAIQTPIFGQAYGGAGATNQDVINYLNAHSSGILNYRGHGSDTEWWQWGPSGSFTATHVNQLTNANRYFVHFDVCCDNMNIVSYNGDCLAESFMKAQNAAIAVNGAIIPSYTIPNHDYDKEFYKAIYHVGINNIGYASNYANITVYQVHGSIGQSNIRTYLWLGDACIDAWTNTMQTMTVTHPAAMLIGTNTLTVNTGVPNALVCAQNAEVYASGYANAVGSITLTFNPAPQIPGMLTITASAHNYLTYQTQIQVIPPSGPYVVYNSCAINDAVVGNNNGQWDYGETVDLSVGVKNVGVQTATNVNCTITTPDPLVTILDGQEAYGNINAGDSLVVPNGFRVQVAPQVEDQHIVNFTLTAVSGTNTWESFFSCIVNAPVVIQSGLVIEDPTGNNNGALDPGETTNFLVTVRNQGHSTVENVNAVLTSGNPLVTVTGNPGSYGTLAPNATGTDSWVVVADASIPSGTVVTMTLAITGGGGYSTTATFDVLVGDERNLPTGPDGYGYRAWDNLDGGEYHPYNWVEIAPAAGGGGTILALTGDDQTVQASLPFTFRYYGQNFTQISVCTNGWLALGSTTLTSYSNVGIPSTSGPPNMVAAFWDDMHAGHGGTQICSYYDAAQHRFVVEWYNLDSYSTPSHRETFEVILYDPAHYPTSTGDGVILVQYNLVNNPSSATFGIENQAQTVGIQYGYNGNWDVHAWPVETGRTITYTTNVAGPAPDVQITLTPINPPIQIPASGGSFDFNASVANNGTSPATFQAWIMTQLPNGSWYGPVLGPIGLTLPGGQTVTRLRTQTVPGSAPAGTYVYRGYVGNYSAVKWDSSSFNFTKQTTGDGAWVPGWSNDGESFEPYLTGAWQDAVPTEYTLGQNYPNPFNPRTSIRFGLPQAGWVKLSVYDLLGRQVAVLADGPREAGQHQIAFDASALASGIYLYRLEAGDYTAVRKMILMK